MSCFLVKYGFCYSVCSKNSHTHTHTHSDVQYLFNHESIFTMNSNKNNSSPSECGDGWMDG